MDSDGIASEVAVACQLIRAARAGAQIINLSLGCQTQDDVPPIAIRAALDVIRDLEREEDREVLVVAAAGNYADTRACWPAAFRQVVSVAALAPDMLPAQWSTHGFWVTCSTIGQGISSTYVEGNESILIDPQPLPAPRGIAPAASGRPGDTGLRPGTEDTPGYLSRAGLPAGVSGPPSHALRS